MPERAEPTVQASTVLRASVWNHTYETALVLTVRCCGPDTSVSNWSVATCSACTRSSVMYLVFIVPLRISHRIITIYHQHNTFIFSIATCFGLYRRPLSGFCILHKSQVYTYMFTLRARNNKFELSFCSNRKIYKTVDFVVLNGEKIMNAYSTFDTASVVLKNP